MTCSKTVMSLRNIWGRQREINFSIQKAVALFHFSILKATRPAMRFDIKLLLFLYNNGANNFNI